MKPNECGKDENGSNVYILSRIQCHVPICCFAFVYPLCHIISFWLFVLFVHFLRVYTFIFGWLCRRRYKLLTAIRSDSHGAISNNTMKKKRIFMKNVPEYFCLLSRQPFGDGFCGLKKNSVYQTATSFAEINWLIMFFSFRFFNIFMNRFEARLQKSILASSRSLLFTMWIKC